jgi:hypothetical protein
VVVDSSGFCALTVFKKMITKPTMDPPHNSNIAEPQQGRRRVVCFVACGKAHAVDFDFLYGGSFSRKPK